MQTRGTFPELNAGLKKSGKRMPKSCGMSFGVKGKGPRQHTAPRTFAGRRAASHARAGGR
jgi:hypothetical protein